jgi:hypothetical protein
MRYSWYVRLWLTLAVSWILWWPPYAVCKSDCWPCGLQTLIYVKSCILSSGWYVSLWGAVSHEWIEGRRREGIHIEKGLTLLAQNFHFKVPHAMKTGGPTGRFLCHDQLLNYIMACLTWYHGSNACQFYCINDILKVLGRYWSVAVAETM